MSVLQTKVLWYSKNDLTTAVELTDVVNVTIRKGLDIKSNTVEVTLQNPVNTYNGTEEVHKHINSATYLSNIQRDDVIEVYARMANDQDALSTTDASYLLTTADITDIGFNIDAKKTHLKLICIDKTYNLLNKVWTQSYTSTDALTAPEIIQKVLRNVMESQEAGINYGYENTSDGVTGTLYTDGTGMYEVDARLETDGGNIADERPDASAFPVVSIGKVYKQVYEWIEDLSQVEYTNSDSEISTGDLKAPLRYIYYIDKENKFHWFYPDNASDYTVTVGSDQNEDLIDFKLKLSVFDVVNTIFYNAGKGLANESILGYIFDTTTDESRLKMKFKPYTYVATNLRQAEANLGNITLNEDGTVTIDVTSGTTSWGESYSSANDYTTKFFTYAKKKADSEAQAFISKRGSPRLKGNLTFVGKDFTPGEVMTVTARQVGVVQKNIRIQNVTHQIDKNSWRTTLDLEEDEKERT